MSDISGGPGWWLASDGKWYSPEQRPGVASSAPIPTPQPGAQPFQSSFGGAMPNNPYGAPGFPGGYGAPQFAYPAGPYGPPTKKSMPTWGIVLIIVGIAFVVFAILLAIAIPTFLGVRSSADDRATQSNLINGDTFVQAYYSSYISLDALTPAVLESSESQLIFQDAATPAVEDSNEISMAVTPSTVILAAASASGTCWFVQLTQVNNGQGSANLTSTYNSSSKSICDAADAPSGGWQLSFGSTSS